MLYRDCHFAHSESHEAYSRDYPRTTSIVEKPHRPLRSALSRAISIFGTGIILGVIVVVDPVGSDKVFPFPDLLEHLV